MTSPTTPPSSPLDTLKHTVFYVLDLLEAGQDQIGGAITDADLESGQELIDFARGFLVKALAEHLDGIDHRGGFLREQFSDAAFKAARTYDNGDPVSVRRELGDGSYQVWFPRITEPIPVRTLLRAVPDATA